MPERRTANWEYTLSITGRLWKPDSCSLRPTRTTYSSRPVIRGGFSSLEKALAPAEHRWVTLQADLAQLDGGQQSAVIQLTPAALERHLQGMTEKLRSGVNGKMREAIQQSVARILVGVDGTVTLETKPDGLLGVKAIHVR